MLDHPPQSKDLKLLELIGNSSAATQRELARRSGLSLGMVNLILRRLARTGYIKVANLDRRKMHYLLTPRGIAEKSRQSYEYLVRTIRIYDQYRQRINQLVEQQRRLGNNQFAVYGEGDLADMVEVHLKGLGEAVDYRVCRPHQPLELMPKEVVLNCCLDGDQPLVGISILEAVLSHGMVTQEPVAAG